MISCAGDNAGRTTRGEHEDKFVTPVFIGRLTVRFELPAMDGTRYHRAVIPL